MSLRAQYFRLATALALWCALLAPHAQGAWARPLLVVGDPRPPYMFQQDGEARGFDYETAMEVLRGMGLDVRFEFYPWKRCLRMVSAGQADALLDARISEDRKAYLEYPDEILSTSRTVLFYKVQNPVGFTTLDDLAGLKIATRLGYYYTDEFMESEAFERVPANGLHCCFKMLLAGHVDLAAANLYAGLFMVRAMDIADRIGHTHAAISEGDNYLAFARAGQGAWLAAPFSQALKAFKRSPRYAKIIDCYGLTQAVAGY